MRICDPGLQTLQSSLMNFPRLHFECPRPSMTMFWASKAPTFHSNADPEQDTASKNNADPESKSCFEDTYIGIWSFLRCTFFFIVVARRGHFTFSLRGLDLLLFPGVIGAVEATMDGDVCVLVPTGHISRHLPRQVGLRVLFKNRKLIF